MLSDPLFATVYSSASGEANSGYEYEDDRPSLVDSSAQLHWLYILSHSPFSSSLWAFDRCVKDNDVTKYDKNVYVKAKYFYSWVIKNRSRKIIREQVKHNIKRAKQHYIQTCLSKYLESWRQVVLIKNRSAIGLHQTHVLKKHFNKWKSWVFSSKKDCTHNSKFCDESYLIEFNSDEKKVKYLNSTPFISDTMDELDQTSADYFFSEEYSRWKENEKEKQLMTISSIHYKINLLSDSFHKWRLYTMQKRIERRMDDVARIHYEDTLISSIFRQWKVRERISKANKQKQRLELLRNTFSVWKNMYLLERVSTQRKCLLAREYNRNIMLKKSFQLWKDNCDSSKADRLHKLHQQRRVMRLWQLQHLKRKIQRRLARAHHKKVKQYFQDWKTYTYYQQQTRQRVCCVENNRQRNTLKKYLSIWKHKLEIQIFTDQHVLWKKKMLARKCCLKWRHKIKKKHLLLLAEDFLHIQQEIHLRGHFQRWLHCQQVQHAEYEKEQLVREVLTRRSIFVHFYNWRLVTQQDLLIKPLALSKQTKEMRKCFENWLDWTRISKKRKSSQKSIQLKKLKNTFSNWRLMSEKIVCERRVQNEKEEIVVKKFVCKWTEFVKHKKLYREQRVEFYARYWLDTTQQNKMDREIKQASQINTKIVERTYFFKWLHRSQSMLGQRNEMEQKADVFCKERICYVALVAWCRQLEMIQIVREHRKEKVLSGLRKLFSAWLQYTRTELQNQIENFNQHFDLSVTSNNNNNSPHSTKHLDSRRQSAPIMPTYFTVSSVTTTSPGRFRRQKNIDSLNASSLLTEYQMKMMEDIDVNTEEEEHYASSESVPTQDRLLLQSFTYDSDYDELDGTFSSEEKSENQQQTFNSEDLNNTGFSDVLNFSTSDGKLFSRSPPSWTEHWKRRYRLSKDSAKIRRMSCLSEFLPSKCSTARLPGDDVTGRRFSKPMSRASSYGGDSFMSLPSYPKAPEILNRSLPFVRRQSNEDLLTSGVYSADVSDEDTASIASTAMSESRNKELLLVGTIHHWRNNDVSTVFYAWFKYTARKKFLRQTCGYISEKKNEYLLHTMFLRWNRELYGIQASTHTLWKQTTKRCLRQWKNFTSLKRWKKEKLALANDHYRLTTLRNYKQLWGKKYNMKKCLTGITNVWKKSTNKNKADEQLVIQHQQRWNHVIKSMMFVQWKENKAKMAVAGGHYKDSLLNRILNIWWCQVLVKESRRSKIDHFQMQHLLARKFQIWKRKLYCVNQVQSAQKTKLDDLQKLVFTKWLQWTKDCTINKQRVLHMTHQRNHQLQKDALLEWTVYWRQQVVAKQHFSKVISRKILLTWFTVTVDVKERKRKLDNHVMSKQNKMVQKYFLWWNSCRKASKTFNLKISNEGKVLLRDSFRQWRRFNLAQKCCRYYGEKLSRKYFLIWKNSFVVKKKELTLMKQSSQKWLSRMQTSHINENNLKIHVQTKDGVCLKESFTLWKHQTKLLLQAKQHYNTSILKRAVQCWCTYERRCKDHKKLLLKYQQERKAKLMMSAFSLWRSSMQKILKLQIIRDNLLDHNVRRMATKWRRKVKVKKLERNHNRRIMETVLNVWQQKLLAKRKAVNCNSRNCLKRSLTLWRSFIHRKKYLNNLLNERQATKSNKLLRHTFTTWSMRREQSQTRKKQEEANLQIAEEHFHMSLLRASFHEWRVSTLFGKLKKKRDQEICRKYVMKWMEIVAMKHLATLIYTQNTMHRVWICWRKTYIQRKVVENFAMQERRRVMSEVFAAWFEYTRLKRTLPETNNFETKKMWFRKWMSIYNEN